MLVLSPQIENIVLPDQFGFVRTRNMSVASTTVLSLIDEIKVRVPEAAVVFLDLAAAFDTARQDSLNFILKRIFSESELPELIANLTNEGEAFVFVNGFISEFFRILCGTGQGDPASSNRFLPLMHFFVKFLLIVLGKRPEGGGVLVSLPVGGEGESVPPPALRMTRHGS